jgi:hypothetical protein
MGGWWYENGNTECKRKYGGAGWVGAGMRMVRRNVKGNTGGLLGTGGDNRMEKGKGN